MNISQQIWFKLFACCVIVEGISGSLLYDLDRGKFYDISNEYLDIIKYSMHSNLIDTANAFEINVPTISKFFDNFVNMEVGFYTKTPKSFPNIDFTWYAPNSITNSIVEYGDESEYNIYDVIAQLNSLACVAIQIRLVSNFSLEWIASLLDYFKKSRIKHIELLMPYDEKNSLSKLTNLMKNEPRLNSLFIYNATEESLLLNENQNQKVIAQFVKDIRVDNSEIISAGRFVANIKLFSEAQAHNTGLNRKVCINSNGEIKNYLSHDHFYGNVNQVNLQDVVNEKVFKYKWFITNDQIEVCNQCQYRYACVSNSDLIVNENKLYKKNYCASPPPYGQDS